MKVRVIYFYEMAYRETPRFGENATALPVGGAVVNGRKLAALEATFNLVIGDFDFRRLSIGSWTLSAHHTYDPLGQILHLGDGTERRAQAFTKSIQTVAGGGAQIGDGEPATEAQLFLFNGGDVAFAADGSMFLSETPSSGGRIRKISTAGVTSTIAGGGAGSALGDGGPAIEATFARPQGLAVGPDGSLYIVDSRPGDANGSRIRKIVPDANGRLSGASIITTVAGGGTTFQDNVPATQTILRLDQHPTGYGLAVGADGSIFIPDGINFRVRKVGTDGLITTVAGAGNVNPPNFGDEGPATEARVIDPTGVAVDPLGNLYLTAEGRVRKVTPDGIIHTVAGSPPNTGDSTSEGIPATQARVGPFDIVASADGSFSFTETDGSHPGRDPSRAARRRTGFHPDHRGQ